MSKEDKYIFDFLVEMSESIREYQVLYPNKIIKEVAVDENHYDRIKKCAFVWIVDLDESLYFLGTKIVKETRFVGTFTSIRSDQYFKVTARR